MGRLRAYLVIGAYPYSMMNYPVEMAPIDETAEAIVRLCSTPEKCCIFHPYNNHYVPLGDIILQMKRMGMNIKLAEDDEFAAMLSDAQNDPEKAAKLTTLLAYDDRYGQRIYHSGAVPHGLQLVDDLARLHEQLPERA